MKKYWRQIAVGCVLVFLGFLAIVWLASEMITSPNSTIRQIGEWTLVFAGICFMGCILVAVLLAWQRGFLKGLRIPTTGLSRPTGKAATAIIIAGAFMFLFLLILITGGAIASWGGLQICLIIILILEVMTYFLSKIERTEEANWTAGGIAFFVALWLGSVIWAGPPGWGYQAETDTVAVAPRPAVLPPPRPEGVTQRVVIAPVGEWSPWITLLDQTKGNIMPQGEVWVEDGSGKKPHLQGPNRDLIKRGTITSAYETNRRYRSAGTEPVEVIITYQSR